MYILCSDGMFWHEGGWAEVVVWGRAIIFYERGGIHIIIPRNFNEGVYILFLRVI